MPTVVPTDWTAPAAPAAVPSLAAPAPAQQQQPHAHVHPQSQCESQSRPQHFQVPPQGKAHEQAAQKETFPLALYRVLMASSEESPNNTTCTSNEDDTSGENPSEGGGAPTKKKKKTGYDDIVHWLPEGTHFVIIDTQRFISEVMAKEFGVSQKLTSFTRRLSRWGFQQVRCPGYAQHMAFCHPKFRRGDRAAAATIRSVQAEQGAKNAARAEALSLAAARQHGVGVGLHGVGAGVYPGIPAADAPPGALTGALPLSGTLPVSSAASAAALPYSAPAAHAHGSPSTGLGLGLGLGAAAYGLGSSSTAASLAASAHAHAHDPIVAARLRAAAALEVEEETIRIQHLERQLQIQQAVQAHHAATAAATNPYDHRSYLTGVGAGIGAEPPHVGLKSLAARSAASALTRRYSGTGSSLATGGEAAVVGGVGASAAAGPSLAELHYAQAAKGLPMHVSALHQAQAQLDPIPAGSVADLSHAPPSIFGEGGEIYEKSSPLEREIMLQARYKHLLNLQASLQRKALVNQQHQLHIEEQQYLAAQQPPSDLTAAASAASAVVGAGVGAAGHLRLLPQETVDTTTRNVLAGATAVIQRDSLLGGYPAL